MVKRVWSIVVSLALVLALLEMVGCAGPPVGETSESPSPSSSSISQEEAIEVALKALQPSMRPRADVKAELHGDVWVVTLDNLNATCQELLIPKCGGPQPPPGTPEAKPEVYRCLIVDVDAETGETKAYMLCNPKPGPYISEEEAILSVNKRFPVEAAACADIYAYMKADEWVVTLCDINATPQELGWPTEPDKPERPPSVVADLQVSLDGKTGAVKTVTPTYLHQKEKTTAAGE